MFSLKKWLISRENMMIFPGGMNKKNNLSSAAWEILRFEIGPAGTPYYWLSFASSFEISRTWCQIWRGDQPFAPISFCAQREEASRPSSSKKLLLSSPLRPWKERVETQVGAPGQWHK